MSLFSKRSRLTQNFLLRSAEGIKLAPDRLAGSGVGVIAMVVLRRRVGPPESAGRRQGSREYVSPDGGSADEAFRDHAGFQNELILGRPGRDALERAGVL